MIDYYALLKIPQDADESFIKAHFERFKTELANFSPGLKLNEQEIKIQFKEIYQAYLTLLDPVQRKEYDKNHPRQTYGKPNETVEAETIESESKSNVFVNAMYFVGFLVFLAVVLYFFGQFFRL